MLQLYAGETAIRRIKEEGLGPELFDYMLGASGGPKWFTLAGLDRVVFPEFFAGRKRPLHLIGSSAGAFRFACAAQGDPLQATNRLAERYSHTRYSDKPDAQEISEKGRALLDYVLQDTGVEEIINNPVFKAHFIVARCQGLTRFEPKLVQMSGLALSAAANALNRSWLDRFYQRVVFSTPDSGLRIVDPAQLHTEFLSLTKNNLKQALMASGSIPVVLEGVEDIPDAPKGMYRDGGIVDYHFDLSFGPSDGLTLYPHFYDVATPGWFDKGLKHRRAHHSSFDKVLMVVPSREYVAKLPFGKIPDRKDFESMQADHRIAYWQQVIAEGDRLGEAFLQLVERQDIASLLQPITFTR